MQQKDLKAQNEKSIWVFLSIHGLILFGLLTGTTPSFTWLNDKWQIIANNALAGAITPILSIILGRFLSSDIKAILVFWRFSDVLPGHRAFSKLIHKDVRIDIARLKEKQVAFPSSPRDQNTLWYKLLKKHDSKPVISAIHRQFLLLRDLSALLVIMLFLMPVAFGIITLIFNTHKINALKTGVAYGVLFIFIEYLIVAVAARNAGNRLVTTVLAEEASS